MENKNSITHVILTGGVGSRLWPLSRKVNQQYLEIFDGKSLFEMTVERNRNIANKVMVVGNIDNCHLSKKSVDKSNTSYVDIIESTPRNTAAAIALPLSHRIRRYFSNYPSDHIIDEMQLYEEAIQEAIESNKWILLLLG
jgi:mannose-1-phosphate guanylyltransferase